MNINCVVVDDEPLARGLIEGYVNQTPFLTLTGSYSNAIEAFEIIMNGNVQLVFLDIQMPNLNGMELSKMLQGNTKIIFITAFEQYALEGYKVDALDYLLKPVNYADFLKAASKSQKWFSENSQSGHNSASYMNPSILIKSDYKLLRIDTSDILYVEGDKDYVHIHLNNSSPVMTLMSMKSISDLLYEEDFVRVHRSFIVNINKIKTIEKNRIVFDKTLIPISDSYKENFMRIFTLKNSIAKPE